MDMLIPSGIKPLNIRRKSNTIKLYKKTLKTRHTFYILFQISANQNTTQRLRSCEYFTTKFKQIKWNQPNVIVELMINGMNDETKQNTNQNSTSSPSSKPPE